MALTQEMQMLKLEDYLKETVRELDTIICYYTTYISKHTFHARFESKILLATWHFPPKGRQEPLGSAQSPSIRVPFKLRHPGMWALLSHNITGSSQA